EVERLLIDRSWLRPEIAPRRAAPIVRTDPCEGGNFRLDERPVCRQIPCARRQYDGRRSISGAIEMEPVAAEVDEFARRSRSDVGLCGDAGGEKCESKSECQETHRGAPQ